MATVEPIVLDGETLTTLDVIRGARGIRQGREVLFPRLEFDPDKLAKISEIRKSLENVIGSRAMYGVNTGCGIRKAVILPNEELRAYQQHYIPAHCVGTGEPFPDEVVRAAILLRANSFARGQSGVRPELCLALVDLYNRGLVPVVPEQGSVGSSGDLCPLAHLTAALMGLPGQAVRVPGRTDPLPADEALRCVGLEPLVLEAKEAMAMTNGTAFILANGLLAVHDAQRVLRASHLAAALSIEAIRGELAALDPRIHAARNHPGQVRVAAQVAELLRGSTRCTDAIRDLVFDREKAKFTEQSLMTDVDGRRQRLPRVQDAYSFRCYPQVAGASTEEIEFVAMVLGREINAATDNPLVFPDEQGLEVLSGGNFHGEPLAHACDLLKIAVAALANISERRLYALLMPQTSYGLPADLAGPSDLNTGLMILQYMAAALVSENKVLCHPASVDSIPTSANQEDYVSMGTIAARHARLVVKNAMAVVAAELLAACQGIRFTEEELGFPALGQGTARVYAAVRDRLDRDQPLVHDRYLHADHQAVIRWLEKVDLLEEGDLN